MEDRRKYRIPSAQFVYAAQIARGGSFHLQVVTAASMFVTVSLSAAERAHLADGFISLILIK